MEWIGWLLYFAAMTTLAVMLYRSTKSEQEIEDELLDRLDRSMRHRDD